MLPDLSTALWCKSSASETAQGCVEVAVLDGGFVAVRDSKDTTRDPHVYPAGDWQDLVAYLRGERPAAGRIRVDVSAGGVTLSDSHDAGVRPHEYTHHEWTCFVDGVRNREPQLIAA
ncbi:DUF397 domain-containing protein [Streptomyces sp. NPDC048290]|uniref:DUF397 domain-containing protein n=1 Tax=Streptomyces sp. NPDC048290 TaxID=3155811 RepID=UPI00342CE9AB